MIEPKSRLPKASNLVRNRLNCSARRYRAYVVAIQAMNYERTQLHMVMEGLERYGPSTTTTPAEVNGYAQRERQLTQAMTVLTAELPREMVAAELARLERDSAAQ